MYLSINQSVRGLSHPSIQPSHHFVTDHPCNAFTHQSINHSSGHPCYPPTHPSRSLRKLPLILPFECLPSLCLPLPPTIASFSPSPTSSTYAPPSHHQSINGDQSFAQSVPLPYIPVPNWIHPLSYRPSLPSIHPSTHPSITSDPKYRSINLDPLIWSWSLRRIFPPGPSHLSTYLPLCIPIHFTCVIHPSIHLWLPKWHLVT